jgi:hypothetical protein
VTAATNGEQKAFLSCKVHTRDNVRHVGAANDEPWTAVDHPIHDVPRVFVLCIALLYQLAPQAGS